MSWTGNVDGSHESGKSWNLELGRHWEEFSNMQIVFINLPALLNIEESNCHFQRRGKESKIG